MFQGETAITIDDKGRMSIPTALRESIASVCGNRMVFTYNPFESGCLWLYPVRDWEKVRDQVTTLSEMVAVHRNLRLKLVGAATPADVDGSGRVLIPPSQRAAAGLVRSRDAHGGQSVGIFSCSKATNEVNYLAQKFLRVALGSNNIDSCNRT